ncbi:hypothetical protein SDC9_209943 [bioreactor metagenome]|uniref:Uncharacterized protein n=1 Tax=bioreactor metagenome TaxID=1076179 RepID=A0A645JFE1_9ZZZZ
MHPPRHDVGRRQQAQRNGGQHRKGGAPYGDLQRHQHFFDIRLPLREIGGKELGGVCGHVAGVAQQVQRAHVCAFP